MLSNGNHELAGEINQPACRAQLTPSGLNMSSLVSVNLSHYAA